MASKSEISANKVNILEYVLLLGKLKSTPRTGWVRCNVRQPESIADHMFRMAALSFCVDPESGLDKDRCIKLCLVHDMAEAIVGDLTPWDGVSKEEKTRRERDAMSAISRLVPDHAAGELLALWEEYEGMTSREAEFVKDLDKYDMVAQAWQYEREEGRPPGDLQQFFTSTQGKFHTEQVKGWVEELHAARGAHTHTRTDSLDVDGCTHALNTHAAPTHTSEVDAGTDTPPELAVAHPDGSRAGVVSDCNLSQSEPGTSRRDTNVADFLGHDNLEGGELHAVVPLPWCPHLAEVAQISDEGIDARAACAHCDHVAENWLCLTCYEVACSRYVNEHMLLHSLSSEHRLVLSLADLSVWCYACDAYIHNEVVIPHKCAAYRSKFGEDMSCTT